MGATVNLDDFNLAYGEQPARPDLLEQNGSLIKSTLLAHFEKERWNRYGMPYDLQLRTRLVQAGASKVHLLEDTLMKMRESAVREKNTNLSRPRPGPLSQVAAFAHCILAELFHKQE